MDSQPTKGLSSLIGLQHLKTVAARDIKACLLTKETFPNTALFGCPGVGKSSFAAAVCFDLGYYYAMIEGAMCRTRRQIYDRLTTECENAKAQNKPLLFFIDEAHRLAEEPQEALYYPMLTGKITGHADRLHRFSIFAATTHPYLLLGPFRSRLQNEWYFCAYEQNEIERMIANWWTQDDFKYDFNSLAAVAKRSLGVPRNAYNIAKKVRNEALAKTGQKRISLENCENTFTLERIDPIGLTSEQVLYLQALGTLNSPPKGIGGIAGTLGRDVEVVSESIEPILLSLGFVERTARGRLLTAKGFQHLKETNQLTGSLKGK